MTVTTTASSVADPTKSASATISVLGPHRIGVRQTATNAEFYDRLSGKTFVPRGNNYIRLGWELKFDGTNIFEHVTFNVGSYDATRAETALAAMQLSGYNVVTVTTVGCCTGTIGDPAGGLSKAYIANVVDFLRRARAHNIAVTIANQWLPDYGGYTQSLGPCSGQFELATLETLSSCGVAATRAYYTDLLRALIDAAAPLDAIASLELWDEYSYDITVPPLNATSGSVMTANGQTYDLGDAASRQQMMDDGLVYYADQVGAAIRSLDPTMLVTISFFPPQGPNPSRIGDPRVIQVYPAVAHSTLDYIDLHAYPIAYGLTMAQTVENFGMAGYLKKQPVLMGEFGAFTSMYPTITDAAPALKDWQVQSCAYGFQGWLLWTWDTDEQPELWNALSQGGVINQALSPVQRPDPCS